MGKAGSNVIIHIGLHKTGSTYLQSNFFTCLQGIEVIEREKYFDYFSYQVKSELPDMFLLSNESLSGSIWDIEQLKGKKDKAQSWISSFEYGIKKLSLLFPEASILVFFRRHGDLVVSLYKQYVHEGGALSFGEFYGESGIIRDTDLSFERRVEFLKSHFERVYILSFEDFKRYGDAYVIRFFAGVNIGYTKTEMEKEKVNIGLSGVKLRILRAVNPVYIRLPIKLRYLFNRLNISPRMILQDHLSFWKPKEDREFVLAKKQINEKFRDDWDLIERLKFDMNKK